MVNFRIEVIVDPAKAVAGSRRIRGELGRTQNAADRLRNTFRRLFAGLGVALVVRELARLTDAFTNLQNRVRTVTDGQDQLTAVTDRLFLAANRTRVAFDLTAEVVRRLNAQAVGSGGGGS